MQVMVVLLCLVVYIQVFIVLAFALRLIPTLLRFAGACVQLFLVVSYRFYRMLLTPVADFVRAAVGIDVLAGLWRIAATVFLSLAVGLLIIAVTPLVVSVPAVVICFLHGLLVGIIWDEAEHPGNLHLGARLQ